MKKFPLVFFLLFLMLSTLARTGFSAQAFAHLPAVELAQVWPQYSPPQQEFAGSDADSEKILVIDKLRRLSKTEQFRDFPFVRDAECIGAFKDKKLLGCFWAHIVHSNIRPDLSFKISFRNFDAKKASDLIALYQGSEKSFIFGIDYTVGIFTSKHGIELVYRAIQGHYGLGYFGDPVAFFAVAPAIKIGLPQALSWNLTLAQTTSAL